MPLQATSGAASYDGFGGGVVAEPNYIESCFSTYLYTGNGSTQTITNNIDLSGKGGATWLKVRDLGGEEPTLFSTNTNYGIGTNTTGFNTRLNSSFWSPTSSGFDILSGNPVENENAKKYVSWTFRKQPKFFDIQTYTGNGTARSIVHSLGSTPGCVIIKSTSGTGSWAVWHRSGTQENRYAAFLNFTDAYSNQGSSYWGTPLTDAPNMNASTFSVGTTSDVNGNGVSYVAYLFAHNAGGFGLTGTDNVISCGSFTLTGGEDIIDLGYEPQWILTKRVNAALNWQLTDNMRGMTVSNSAAYLYPNLSNAETSGGFGLKPTATGISITAGSTGSPDDVFIYIAIRRGPMKVPTSGTSVLATVTRSGTGATAIITGASSPPDLVVVKSRSNATEFAFTDRLRGVTKELSPAYTFSEADFGANPTVSINMNGWTAPAGYGTFNQSGYTYVDYLFSRWPNVFDEVCYTGTGVARTVAHNLGVVPELMIVKTRSGTSNWFAYTSTTGNTQYLLPNATIGVQTATSVWNNTTPTASVFTLGSSGAVNGSGSTYVAYLFATLAGISKVGTYTGTGTSQVINCGFTSGARWVLIKRTDSTGDWYVWDTARGMVSGTDPYMIMNDALAETNANYVFTSSTGFTIQSGVPAAINANGGTFIFLAIA